MNGFNPQYLARAGASRADVTGYRNQAPGFDPRSGEGARRFGGRFNPPGSFPTLYLCSITPATWHAMRRVSDAPRAGENAAMTAGLRLHKLHGLGNDFLVAFVDELPADADAAGTAAALCHRRRGVGADGLIYAVTDSADGGGDGSVRMQLRNSDGSSAEVSGNGLRCLAHAVAVIHGSAELDIVVRTGAGERRCRITSTDTPGTVVGTTEMGSLGPGPLPDRLSRSPEVAVDRILGPDAIARWATLDVGNPHVVLAVDDPSDVPLESAGPAVEAIFSGGINVHFGAVTGPDEITLGVWERGAGATAACGTGAVAAASAFHGWGEVGQNVTVRMAGGEARVDLSGPVTLTGDSTYVAAVDVARA